MSSPSLESEQASTMKHGRDLEDVMSQAVNDSVVAVDYLAGSTRRQARVVLESFHGGDQPFNDKVGVLDGVAGDMCAYRLDVLDCLRCPDDLGHRRSRRFASA
jgi:hypothetical protein